MRKLALLSAFLALPVLAVDLPQHFIGVGMGFQNSGTPRATGWTNSCLLTVSPVYTCMATDYLGGGAHSARVDVFPQIATWKGLHVFGRAGAGAATSVTGGVGGSFDVGGALALPLPVKILGLSGMWAVASGSWNKSNVMQASDLRGALQRFGSDTIWRFGVGKGW